MMGWITFGSFFVLMLIGVPIGLAIGLAALIVFIVSGIPPADGAPDPFRGE